MKPYPAFKHTGVNWIGDIPEDWIVRRAKYVYQEIDERSEDDSETLLSVSEYYGVAPRANIIEEGDWLTRANSLVGYKKCRAGDLVVNIMLAWKRGLGVTDQDGIVSPAYVVFRLKNRVDKAKYFHYLLRTDLYTAEFHRNSTGIIDSRLRLYSESFFDIRIIVPSPAEQRAIATFLDDKIRKIDTLIEKKQRLIDLLKEQRTAIINQAVTKGINIEMKMKDSGIEWVGKIPEHWEVKKLKYIKSTEPNAFVDGPFGSNLKTVHFVENGNVLVVESGFITSGEYVEREFKTITLEHFETIRRSECKAGDIIIAKIGANYGMSGILPELGKPAVVSGNSLKLTVNPDRHFNKFIQLQLLALKANGALKLIVNETAQPALSLGLLNDLSLVVPNSAEQIEIVRFVESELDKVDMAISQAGRGIGLLQEYRTALISEIVTGKIDVRNYVSGKNN